MLTWSPTLTSTSVSWPAVRKPTLTWVAGTTEPVPVTEERTVPRVTLAVRTAAAAGAGGKKTSRPMRTARASATRVSPATTSAGRRFWERNAWITLSRGWKDFVSCLLP